MKKFLSAVLIIALSFTLLTACTKKEESPEPVVEEVKNDGGLILEDGLPFVAIPDDLESVMPDSYDGGEGLAKFINHTEGAELLEISVFAIPKNDRTALEIAEAYVAANYSDYPELVFLEMDSFNGQAANCVHYVVFDQNKYADYTYCSSFFLEGVDTVYEIDYWTAAKPYLVPGTKVQFFAPAGAAENAVGAEDGTDFLDLAYASEFSNVAVWSYGEGVSFDDVKALIESEMDPDAQFLEYEFDGDSGKSYDCLIATYLEDSEGIILINTEYILNIDGVMYGIDFYQENDTFSDYKHAGIVAMTHAFKGL